ncbi:baeRF2 domain-containing protein [Arthrobacter sp. Z1-15]
MIEAVSSYADLCKREGPWCMAYVDAGIETFTSRESLGIFASNARSAMEEQGASPEDLDAIESAALPARGHPSPVSRYILVRHGQVELNELLPGPPVQAEATSVSAIPDLLPLIKHRPDEYPYLVAEVSRDGAEISLNYAGVVEPAEVQDVQGETIHLSRLSRGGISHTRMRRRTKEVWRRNADQVAEEIDRIARSGDVRLIMLAGDVRARGLVLDQLTEASRGMVSIIDTHTAGSDGDGFDDEIHEQIALQWAAEQDDVMDRLAQQKGQDNPGAAAGMGAVVRAFQKAQVDTLVINDQALAGSSLLALDAEPWIASAEEEAHGVGMLGWGPAPAALLRSAALTDAKVLLVPPGVLPGGLDAAALLRWPNQSAAAAPMT